MAIILSISLIFLLIFKFRRYFHCWQPFSGGRLIIKDAISSVVAFNQASSQYSCFKEVSLVSLLVLWIYFTSELISLIWFFSRFCFVVTCWLSCMVFAHSLVYGKKEDLFVWDSFLKCVQFCFIECICSSVCLRVPLFQDFNCKGRVMKA